MDSPTCFGDRLAAACREKKSAVCVGLDPRWNSLPESVRSGVDESNPEQVAQATEMFCREVIDATSEAAPVVKPQAAFFECLGPAGMAALFRVIQHARRMGMIVLLDGKRGDIGSTAEGYAQAYLGAESAWQCDALTVNPYLGDDTLLPFVHAGHEQGAGIFVLVKTSNPGSGFLQDQTIGNGTIYQRVARTVQQLALQQCGESGFGSVGAVVGATYPEQLAQMREEMPNAWILIPGFGAQGGTADDVRHGFLNGSGAIVNSSRGIIFAFNQDKASQGSWQEAVATAAAEMRDQLAAAMGA